MKRNIPSVVIASAVSILSAWTVAQAAPHAKLPGQDAPGGNRPSAQGQDRINDVAPTNAAWHNAAAAPANPAQNARDREDSALSSSSLDNDLNDKDADNSARNVRDRDDQTLTPLDQGNSEADVDTTAQIRKEILAGENMSVNARNVKVITRDGRVTLRGPVNSANEKRIIGDIALRILKTDNVDNQLEVTVPKVSSNN